MLGLALLTLSWDKNWDSHSLVNGYPSFYPRIALVAPSPGGKWFIHGPKRRKENQLLSNNNNHAWERVKYHVDPARAIVTS